MTKERDDKAWDGFVSWCRSRGLSALPANPWTLAAYARWCERRQRYPAIARNLKAIARIHDSKTRKRPFRHPTVTRTLSLIQARARERAKAKPKSAELFPEDDMLGAGGRAAPKRGAPKKKTPRRGLSTRPKLVSRRRLKK